MKPTTVTVQAVSTVGTAAQTMSIDPDGMATILSILSNMYSDGNLAVVREYASNARDSHVEAGNDGPILVTSPNHFSPTLTVQDFGTGLSRDEVLGVYARYGASTKRATDTQIGSFGIGAKSAFTVGAQFVVTAVKNGEMTVALFALDAMGSPTVNILSHQDTLEPDGVKVEIAVKDVDGVTNAVERLFSTWDRGTVLVDGVEPSSIWDTVEPMADDIHIGWKVTGTWRRWSSWTLVMGGIPYTLPSSVVDALEYRPRTIVQNIVNSQALVYLTVPIGAVDITPSREELRNTDKTVATVNAMADKFHLALGGWVSDQIAGEPTLIAAMLKHDSLRHNLGWMARLGPSTITWKGIPIPNTMVHTDLDWFALTRKRGGGITARRQENLDVPPGILLSRIMFITGVPEHKLRSVQIAAKEYLTAQDAGDQDRVRTVAALPPGETVFAKEWFTTVDPAVRTMTYDAFIANWKPAQSPSAPRGATRYNLFEDSARTAKELKSETTIYYVTSYDRPNVNPQNDFTRGVVGDAPLVLLRSTQKAHVLVQRLPQAVNLVTVVKKHAEDVLASVTQDDIDALDAEHVLRSVARTMMAWLREIETDITHTGVLAVIDQYDRASNLVDASHDRVLLIHQALRYAGRSQDTLGRSTWDVAAWDRVINTLPLLTSYFRTDWLRSAMGNNHAVSYINMVGDLTGAHTA